MSRTSLIIYLVGLVFAAACGGQGSDNGKGGGHPCTVEERDDGTKRLACSDGSEVTLHDGTDGVDGAKGDSCTLTDESDGSRRLTCDDGTEVVIRDGDEAACAGNSPPVFEGVELVNPYDVRPVVGRTMSLRLSVHDPDDDPLSIDFAGAGAIIEPTDDPSEWTYTPQMAGGPFVYTVSVSDGCQVVAGSFSIDDVGERPMMYFGITRGSPAKMWILDPYLGSASSLGDWDVSGVRAMAVNPNDGTFYAHIHDTGDPDTEGLYQVSPFNNVSPSRFVGKTDLELTDMAFSPEGVLFGFDRETRKLVTIDLETAESEAVGTLEDPIAEFDQVGLTFRGNDLFVRVGAALVQVDPGTGRILDYIGALSMPPTHRIQPALEYDPRQDRFLIFESEAGSTETVFHAINTSSASAEERATVSVAELGAIVTYSDVWAPAAPEEFTVTFGTESARLQWTLAFDDLVDQQKLLVRVSSESSSEMLRLALEHTVPVGDVIELPLTPERPSVTLQFALPLAGLAPNTAYSISLHYLDPFGNVSEPATVEGSTLAVPPSSGATLYAFERSGRLSTVDLSDGSLRLVGDTWLNGLDGFAVNPVDGYGYVVSNADGNLYRVDLSDASTTVVGPTGGGNTIRGLTFTPEGVLYGWQGSRQLVRFNLETGELTILESYNDGTSGASASETRGLAWYDNSLVFKSSEGMARIVEEPSGDFEFEQVPGIVGDHKRQLLHPLAFDSNGFGYSVYETSSGRQALVRIDVDSLVTTPVAELPAGVTLGGIDFLH